VIVGCDAYGVFLDDDVDDFSAIRPVRSRWFLHVRQCPGLKTRILFAAVKVLNSPRVSVTVMGKGFRT
jgi:hypothetical protein